MGLLLPSENMYDVVCEDGSVGYTPNPGVGLPMHLRVRWYEHIDGRTDKSNLVEFERWLHKRVDPLFNPLEDFICEEWSKKQRSTMETEIKHQIRSRGKATITRCAETFCSGWLQ